MKNKRAIFSEESFQVIDKTPELPGAYLLTCPHTEQHYVGVSKNLKQRFRSHLRNQYSKFLNFKACALETINVFDSEKLHKLELKYMYIYKPSLNNPKASRYSGKGGGKKKFKKQH
jgi:excinuclease UvrABC nuclease subunit